MKCHPEDETIPRCGIVSATRDLLFFFGCYTIFIVAV